jgi:cyclin H
LDLWVKHDLSADNLEPLSPDEEAKLVLYYTKMLESPAIKQLCPRKVVATAITYLKRFYLVQSTMEHDVLRITLACLYIAGKVLAHTPLAANTFASSLIH